MGISKVLVDVAVLAAVWLSGAAWGRWREDRAWRAMIEELAETAERSLAGADADAARWRRDGARERVLVARAPAGEERARWN